nr:hypothetical protein [Tanacetum cinerariifolium]GEW73508.1 hypothetical protein [Tanacetum cinerariifolium]
MRILLLYRGEYSQWRERFMNYLEEQIDGEAMINSIQNGDQPLPVIAQVSLAGTAQNAPPTLKDPNKIKEMSYDALGYKKKAVVITSDTLALVAEKTNVSKQKEKVVISLDSEGSETIAEVAYYTSESESKSEFKTLKYYNNSTNYGLFVNNDDDQENFHDAIESASENFIENHIDSQKDYDKSEVDHNDSKEKEHLADKLIQKFNHKIAKCQKRVEKANQQIKHDVIDTHVECHEKYARLEEERYEYMIRYSTPFDNDKQHRKQIADQDVLFDKMSVELVELDKHVIAPGMFKLTVSQSVSPISKAKTSCNSNNVENLDTFSSVTRPKNSGVIWKKKGSSNTSKVDLSTVNHLKLNKNVKRYSCKDLLSCDNFHLGETSSAYVCNNAMNVSCNSSMCDLLDDNNFFIFDDESVKISLVSKMPFRKKPRDSMTVRSKSNMLKFLPRTVHLPLDHRFGMFKAYDGKPQQNGVVERRNRTLVEATRTMLTFANLPSFLWAEANSTAYFTQNRSIIHKHFDKTPYELINKRKPNIKFFRVFECRCYLLNDYEDVGKHKAKGDIRVFVGYSKESAGFRIYNKRTRRIHESVNVNFDKITEMASKQFSLEPGLTNLNETRKSSNSSIMKSSTTNVETSINEEVFHEVFKSFQGKSSSSSLNDDVQQSSEEFILPQTNTQTISNNMIPNVDEASTSHNVFNECLEDAYFDASTSFHDPSNVHTYYKPYPHEKKRTKDHPLHKIIGDPKSSVRTRGQLENVCLFSCLLSSIEPANVAEALRDADWVSAMQEELDQFARLKVWRLVPLPEGKSVIKTK